MYPSLYNIRGWLATDSYMTLTEHLEELRWCLLKSLAAIVLASGLGYFFRTRFSKSWWPRFDKAFSWQTLIGTAVTEAFFVEIKVALAAGVFFSCPVIFYQIWRFIRPGLSGSEKRLVLPFVLCAIFFWGELFFVTKSFFPLRFSISSSNTGRSG